MSNAAKFQSCRPNTREMVDFWKTRKQETSVGSQSTQALLSYIYLLFSGF